MQALEGVGSFLKTRQKSTVYLKNMNPNTKPFSSSGLLMVPSDKYTQEAAPKN